MFAQQKKAFPELRNRIIWIQTLTLAWMSVEATVSLGAAWMAHSPALLAFGGDSAVEILSATVVLWRFCSQSSGDRAEQQTARIAGGLLFMLVAFVAFASAVTLLGHNEVLPSLVGILMLILAAVVMPWLAKQKRLLCRYRQRGIEGRRCRVCRRVWVSGVDCFGGTRHQCGLESEFGRCGCCVLTVASDCARGMGSNEGQAMLLLTRYGQLPD
jgi:hypothetical protein